MNNYSSSTFYISHPLTVKHGQLNRTTEQDNKIIQHFLKVKSNEDANPNECWKTNWYTHIEHQDVLKGIMDEIHLWYCKNICPPRGPSFITESNSFSANDLHIDAKVWFQEYLPGQFSQQHEHGTLSRFSWVYYLQCGNESSPLTFVKREVEDRTLEINNLYEQHLPVYNKMIVMFPSCLHHKVYPANEKRYVLAGNINDILYEENK